MFGLLSTLLTKTHRIQESVVVDGFVCVAHRIQGVVVVDGSVGVEASCVKIFCEVIF